MQLLKSGTSIYKKLHLLFCHDKKKKKNASFFMIILLTPYIRFLDENGYILYRYLIKPSYNYKRQYIRYCQKLKKNKLRSHTKNLQIQISKFLEAIYLENKQNPLIYEILLKRVFR